MSASAQAAASHRLQSVARRQSFHVLRKTTLPDHPFYLSCNSSTSTRPSTALFVNLVTRRFDYCPRRLESDPSSTFDASRNLILERPSSRMVSSLSTESWPRLSACSKVTESVPLPELPQPQPLKVRMFVFCQTAEPSIFGSSILGADEIYPRLKAFRQAASLPDGSL